MKNLLEILYNLGMLVSLSIVSGVIGHKGSKALYKASSQGLIFGTASVLGMLHPLILAPGLIFDGRSVMISLCGLFFGPFAALIAGAMALSLRFVQGGPGTTMGILVILSSALIGVGFYYNRSDKEQPVPDRALYLMGVLVHITMVLLMLTLPGDMAASTIKLLGLPVILVYPLATVLIGKILSGSNERRRIGEALRISEQKLRESNEELESTLAEVVAQGKEIHEQYERLEKSAEALRASEDSLRSIFEGSADPILIFKQDAIANCNQAALKLFGRVSKDQLIGKKVEALSPERQEDGEPSQVRAARLLEECRLKANIRFEWTHLKWDGTLMTAEVVLTTITLRGDSCIHALIRDISERKALEKKLEHLSYHDQLTGVYNRRFFEEEINRLGVRRNFPLTLMMADVNGLKLINDSFGHAVGDRLLIEVARLIKAGCREDDILSRIGGDEFVVIFPQTGSKEVEGIVNRIQALAMLESVESIDISVSFGWASITTEEDDLREVLKKAENYLYKKKLFESPSMRSKTIHTIIHTLYEKNRREEAHSHRVSAICADMGKALGLSETKIKELKNLGLLHDIGKIAIDEHMLNKPGKLTKEEWQEMTKHPEIGYRILSTVNEMAEMAESVLAHHERWDGGGYPRGLKGEEIPLHARIISLADAFDAMISDRSYRLAMSQEAAVEELRRNAGTQFDPRIVAAFISMLGEETAEWLQIGVEKI